MLGLSKSTVYGLVSTLAQRGYLRSDPVTSRYELGLRALELGGLALSRSDLRASAAPYMRRLVQEHQETVHLAILDEGEVVYIDKQESPQSMRIVTAVGTRLPAHCTAIGKVMLAYLSEDELDQIIRRKGLQRFTRHTITDIWELKRHLAEVRERGYSVDDQEYAEGLKCVGAPVRNHSGKVVAALSVAGPSVRMAAGEIRRIAASVVRAAEELSRELGYSG